MAGRCRARACWSIAESIWRQRCGSGPRSLTRCKLLALPRAGAAERASASAESFCPPRMLGGKVSSRDRRLASSSTVRVHGGLVQRQPRRSFANRWRSPSPRVRHLAVHPVQGQCLFYRTIVPLNEGASDTGRAWCCSCKTVHAARVGSASSLSFRWRRCSLSSDTDTITWLPDVACPAAIRRDVNTAFSPTDRLILETTENARDDVAIHSRALRGSPESCDRGGRKEKLQAFSWRLSTEDVERWVSTSHCRNPSALCYLSFFFFFFFPCSFAHVTADSGCQRLSRCYR